MINFELYTNSYEHKVEVKLLYIIVQFLFQIIQPTAQKDYVVHLALTPLQENLDNTGNEDCYEQWWWKMFYIIQK